MIKLKTSLPQLLAFLISFIAIVIYAIVNSAPSIVGTFTILYALGVILLNIVDRVDRHFFFLSFSLHAVIGILLAISFKLDHGNPFIGGGDDEIFYLISKDYNDGLALLEGREWSAINYKAYIVLMAGWLKFLNLIGLHDDFFFNLNLVNGFLGAFAVYFFYRIFKTITTESIANKIGWFILLYPALIFYSATIIRDTTVMFIFSFTVYMLVVTCWNSWIKFFLFVINLFVMYHIRDASAFFLVVFVLAYHFMGFKGRTSKIVVKAAFFTGLIVVSTLLLIAASRNPPGTLPPKTDIVDFLSFRIHYYNSEILREAAPESLGIKLRNFSNPLVVILGTFYMYLSPLPPMFFVYGLTFGNIFLGLGNFLWYFLGISYIFTSLIKSENPTHTRVWWATLMTLLVTLIVVNFTSGDARHIHYIQPFIIGFSIEFLFTNKRSIFVILALLITCGLAGSILYLILKFT